MTIDRRKYPWVRLNQLQNYPQIGLFNFGRPALRPLGQPKGCSNLFLTNLSLRNIIIRQPLIPT